MNTTPAEGSVYAITKAAVVGLTRGLARDLGPRGITVNTVQPGPVETDMNPAEGASDDSSWITGETFVISGGYR